MTVDEAIREVDTLERRLWAARLITQQGRAALQMAQLALKPQRRSHRDDWSFEIPPDKPLEFRVTDPGRVKLEMTVDLFGQLCGLARGVPTGSHCIVVRVWCHQRSVWFNEFLDNPRLRKEIERGQSRRVMLRFRFDYASRGQDEPWFHLQIGGHRRSGGEYCRMPDNLAVPRFHHHPVGLSMACEFIIKHFYPEAHQEFTDEPSLKAALRVAQRAYLQRFLDRVNAFPQDLKSSFLDHMWQDNPDGDNGP